MNTFTWKRKERRGRKKRNSHFSISNCSASTKNASFFIGIVWLNFISFYQMFDPIDVALHDFTFYFFHSCSAHSSLNIQQKVKLFAYELFNFMRVVSITERLFIGLWLICHCLQSFRICLPVYVPNTWQSPLLSLYMAISKPFLLVTFSFSLTDLWIKQRKKKMKRKEFIFAFFQLKD